MAGDENKYTEHSPQHGAVMTLQPTHKRSTGGEGGRVGVGEKENQRETETEMPE